MDGFAGGARRDPRQSAALSLEALLAVTPPAPRSPLKAGLAGKLRGSQADDVRLIADAAAKGRRAFLLGNATGTGKTCAALGATAQLAPTRALIVVPNRAIAAQWQQVARDTFGLDLLATAPPASGDAGLYVTTYAGLRAARKAGPLGAFDVAIFDEVHREAMKLGERSATAEPPALRETIRHEAERVALALSRKPPSRAGARAGQGRRGRVDGRGHGPATGRRAGRLP